MFVRDVMTTNVVTISSTTSLADARRIMDAHRVRRLPVVDKGKLMGLVTRDALDRAGPSQVTTFSIHELSYLLGKLTVKEVMVKDVVTVSADATVEEGVALAQTRRVGALPVMEDNRLVGIVTTNDFFYKILNPILGIGKPGARLSVHNCSGTADVTKVLDAISKLGVGVSTMFTITHPDTGVQDFTIHLNTEDVSKVTGELQKRGYEVEKRAR